MQVYLLMECTPDGGTVRGAYSTKPKAEAARHRWADVEKAWLLRLGLTERADALDARDYETYNERAWNKRIEIVPMELDADRFGEKEGV